MLAVLLISAAPVTLNATPGAVLLIPTRLLTASTNSVPASMLTLALVIFKTLALVELPAIILNPALDDCNLVSKSSSFGALKSINAAVDPPSSIDALLPACAPITITEFDVVLPCCNVIEPPT